MARPDVLTAYAIAFATGRDVHELLNLPAEAYAELVAAYKLLNDE